MAEETKRQRKSRWEREKVYEREKKRKRGNEIRQAMIKRDAACKIERCSKNKMEWIKWNKIGINGSTL